MTRLQRDARQSAGAFALFALSACSSAGLGNILGGVLGGNQQAAQLTGYVAGLDARSQQIAIQQANGQTVTLAFDNQTQVVYQNQNYSITSLERGDEVTARIQTSNNASTSYYTDLIQVNKSVAESGRGGIGSSENVQSLAGNVREVDAVNGWFSVAGTNFGTLTVSLPYHASRSDVNRFQSLRSGDYVRFYGVFLNNTRVELRQFN
ncbi:MAG: hypothetical protein NVS4B3_16950 [Gemmatimonadaceae bacterium]